MGKDSKKQPADTDCLKINIHLSGKVFTAVVDSSSREDDPKPSDKADSKNPDK